MITRGLRWGGVVILVWLALGWMRAEEPASRLLWLRAEIARHDELYFKKAAPEITDAEYDRLKRELLTLEKSGAGAVGDDRAGGLPTRVHREPMLSLEKAYAEAEVRAFVERTERTLRRDGVAWVVEPKFDGLAVNVTYEKGKLVRAVTRGNGVEGDDVTERFLMIAGVPEALPAGAPELVEVRGEVFMDYAEFARINAELTEAGEEPFAHPRNLAAGTLKSTEAEATKRRLSAVFYGLGAWQGPAKEPKTQEALHGLLKAWGLPGVEALSVVTSDGVWGAVVSFGRMRPGLGYPTDGVVIKVNSRSAQRELGTSDTAPRWAVAYKYAPERVTTRLKAITLQVGRTGVITPVAELEPVKVGGSTVARATLHNADEIARRDLRVGDWVYVEKAGEIIPAITGVDLERREAGAAPFVLPSACAECGATLVKDGAAVRCPNARCAARVERRVEFFASRAGVGIGGLGPALIGRLVAAGKLKSVADVYRLSAEDGVPERVLAEIDRSKTADLGRLITGLGLEGVGKKRAQELAAKYGSLAALAQAEELDVDGKALAVELMAAGVRPQLPNVVP
jgi:DNA ligase (NAD+)